MPAAGTRAFGRLDGRRAFVSGGAQGIGAAIVRSFSDAGAHVVIGDLDIAVFGVGVLGQGPQRARPAGLESGEGLVLDTLVAGGVARSRSDALAWCVRLVGQHTGDWLEQLRTALQDVEKIRGQGPAA